MLADPGRRALYDRSLDLTATSTGGVAGGGTRATAGTARQAPTPAPAPARFPWRGFAVATTLAVIAVAAASLLAEPPAPAAPDGLLQPGSCVSIEPNGDARETACRVGDDAASDIVVELVVPIGVACPFGTAAHRDHQGQGTACLVFPGPPEPG